MCYIIDLDLFTIHSVKEFDDNIMQINFSARFPPSGVGVGVSLWHVGVEYHNEYLIPHYVNPNTVKMLYDKCFTGYIPMNELSSCQNGNDLTINFTTISLCMS